MVPSRMRFRFVLLSLLLISFLAGCAQDRQADEPIPTTDPALARCVPADGFSERAVVSRVVDGDTITIEVGGQEFRLRYIGIDAPELNSTEQSTAEQSTNYNKILVEGQQVILYHDTSETDRFDRLLRYVFVGDVFVNYELVRAGMARARDYPPDSACKDVLRYAERLAKKHNLGIWSKTEITE